MGSPNPRKPCAFLHLLLSFLNFILFLLSAASLAPTIALRTPPTSLGCAFLLISSASLLSSLAGFYSQLTQFCYITHLSVLIASLAGQLLGILALFTKEKSSLSLLRSPRDPREAKLLARVLCGALMAMFVTQLGVLIVSCAVRSCLVREYRELEAEREATAEKRRRKIGRVQEEAMARIAEGKEREMDEKLKNKYGKWMEEL